jgi:ATP-binding cassette subfamily B protein
MARDEQKANQFEPQQAPPSGQRPGDNPGARGPMGFGAPGGMPGGPRGFGGFQRGMPVVKPRNFKKTLLRLWRYFGSERNLLIFILFMVIISAGCGLAGPYLLGRAIDAISGVNNSPRGTTIPGQGNVKFGLLEATILMLGIVYLFDALLNFLQVWLMAGGAQRIIMSLRRSLFAKLQKLPIAFFDMRSHGDLMSRLSNDIDNISGVISQSTTQLMSNIVIFTGSLTMMLILSPLLTLAAVIIVPLVFLLTGMVTKRTRILFKEQQAVLGKLNGQIEETISGIQVVKAFNHEEQAIEEFRQTNSNLCQVGIKALIWSGYIMPLMNVINNIAFLMVAGFGGILAVRNLITIGVIASFLAYTRQFARPLNEIANIYNTLQTAIAGAERVFEILDEPEEPVDLSGAKMLDHPQGRVVFDQVSFSYRPDLPVLKQVSFTAPAGHNIALVGGPPARATHKEESGGVLKKNPPPPRRRGGGWGGGGG